MTIKITQTKKSLSANAGLLIIKKAMHRLSLMPLVAPCMPRQKTGRIRNLKKFRDLIMGLVAGADCLDDMDLLSHDQGFVGLCDEKVYTPKAYGDFLRAFSPENILDLQEALMHQGFQTHQALFPKDRHFFFDMDSTPNYQCGKKMEGVAKNYHKKDCLDSLDVFDANGIQYFINVRPGNTHTSKGCEDVIHRLMSVYDLYHKKSQRKWHACFRADRGYYSVGFINACLAKSADVIIGVKQDEHNFPKIINQIHNWRESYRDDPDRLKFYDGREIEIGTTNFRPKGCARRLRYVIMRAKKPEESMFADERDYDYFAFATTYSEQIMDDEGVIYCYRERGQAENFIKENKNGLDMKHYPCLKLDANRAYALICAFAYNYMRLLSLANDPNKPVYAKKIRFMWIKLPSLVARTSGDIYLKLMDAHYKEMTRWLKLIHNLQLVSV